jgi:hypothetical protein
MTMMSLASFVFCPSRLSLWLSNSHASMTSHSGDPTNRSPLQSSTKPAASSENALPSEPAASLELDPSTSAEPASTPINLRQASTSEIRDWFRRNINKVYQNCTFFLHVPLLVDKEERYCGKKLFSYQKRWHINGAVAYIAKRGLDVLHNVVDLAKKKHHRPVRQLDVLIVEAHQGLSTASFLLAGIPGNRVYTISNSWRPATKEAAQLIPHHICGDLDEHFTELSSEKKKLACIWMDGFGGWNDTMTKLQRIVFGDLMAEVCTLAISVAHRTLQYSNGGSQRWASDACFIINSNNKYWVEGTQVLDHSRRAFCTFVFRVAGVGGKKLKQLNLRTDWTRNSELQGSDRDFFDALQNDVGEWFRCPSPSEIGKEDRSLIRVCEELAPVIIDSEETSFSTTSSESSAASAASSTSSEDGFEQNSRGEPSFAPFRIRIKPMFEKFDNLLLENGQSVKLRKPLIFNVNFLTNLQLIKRFISACTNIPSAEMSLIFDGNQINGNPTLRELDIFRDTSIFLTLRENGLVMKALHQNQKGWVSLASSEDWPACSEDWPEEECSESSSDSSSEEDDFSSVDDDFSSVDDDCHHSSASSASYSSDENYEPDPGEEQLSCNFCGRFFETRRGVSTHLRFCKKKKHSAKCERTQTKRSAKCTRKVRQAGIKRQASKREARKNEMTKRSRSKAFRKP